MKTIATLLVTAAFLFARPALAADEAGGDAPKAEKKHHGKKAEKKEDKKDAPAAAAPAPAPEKKADKAEKGGW